MCGGGQERNTSAKVFSYLINNLIFQDENNLKLNANAATLYAFPVSLAKYIEMKCGSRILHSTA